MKRSSTYVFALIVSILFVVSGSSAARGETVPTSERSLKIRAQQLGTASHPGPLRTEVKEKGLRVGSPVFIRIFKQTLAPGADLTPAGPGVLELWMENKKSEFSLFKSYPVASYSGHLGPKNHEGDLQAPEGVYSIAPDQLNPESIAHLAINLGFPNTFDSQQGWTGSYLMIHGGDVSFGCYSMTDPRIEEIYVLVEAAFLGGQSTIDVHAFPFPLTLDNLQAAAALPWYDFWSELAPGYSFFEDNRIPPHVRIVDGRYVFER